MYIFIMFTKYMQDMNSPLNIALFWDNFDTYINASQASLTLEQYRFRIGSSEYFLQVYTVVIFRMAAVLFLKSRYPVNIPATYGAKCENG